MVQMENRLKKALQIRRTKTTVERDTWDKCRNYY